MAKLYELDWGYKVRITEGEHVGKEGIVVMGYRNNGKVEVCFLPQPALAQRHHTCAHVQPSAVEILLAKDIYGLKEHLPEVNIEDIFEGARWYQRLMSSMEE